MVPQLPAHIQALIDARLADIYRGRVIPIIRGGDGRDEEGIFPSLPEDLKALTDDELDTLAAEIRGILSQVKARDPEVVGDAPDWADVLAQAEAAADSVLQIQAEKDERVEAEETLNAELEALTAKAGVNADADADGGDDPDDPDGGDAGDGAGDGDAAADAQPAERELEPVAASAKPVRRTLPQPRKHRPETTAQPDGAALLASTQVYPYAEAGERLTQRRLGEVMADVINKNRINYGQTVVIASVSYDYPEGRILGRDAGTNLSRVSQVSDAMLKQTPQALVASGGLCAPLTPIYDMPDVEVATRPVRDALANFRADRGGVIVPVNPTIGDYAEAVGTVTAEDDELGGTYAVKNCMRIECPTFPEVVVDSIYTCIEAGNLTARAYPELMSRIETLVRANQARFADGFLLTGIKAGSTAVTGPNTTSSAGAVWKLLGHAHAAAAGMRSRHRMSDNARLRALFPEWIIDLLTVDLGRNDGDSDRFKTRQEIEAILGRAGINATFYKDGPDTGTGQVFAAQTAGAMLGFPADTQWALYPEGSWLHLDAGQLDLGIVRDSTLNSTNDFQVFAETWEQAAFVGVESLWITSTLGPNGTNSAPKDFSASTNF